MGSTIRIRRNREKIDETKTKKKWWKTTDCSWIGHKPVIYWICDLSQTTKKIVLTFGMFAGNKWDVPDDNCYQMIDQVIKEFEKEYPNVTIKYESGVMKDDYSEWHVTKGTKRRSARCFYGLARRF